MCASGADGAHRGREVSLADAQAIAGIPEWVGRYRIVRPLSKGGMALVYEAELTTQVGVKRRVAIKVILPNYADSETYRDLFINEARIGAAMQHRNLVQILDFGAEGSRYYLAMEFVEGLTLSRIIALAARHDVRVPSSVLCEIGRQTCEGLHHAHEALDAEGRHLRMIHRDIKPTNLILNPEGVVKILDFGVSLARLRQERRGSVRGTWGYMSPEQASGEPLHPNADVFSVGIVLYELAARRAMFHRLPNEEIKEMLRDDHPERIVATLDAPYAPLVGVLDRALKRDPRERYPTAKEFGCQLADLLPDPHTTRSELSAFYAQIQELDQADQQRRRREHAGVADAAPAPRVRAEVLRSHPPSSARGWGGGQVGSAILGAGVVVGSLLLGFGVVTGARTLWAGEETATPGPQVHQMTVASAGDGSARVAAKPSRPVPVGGNAPVVGVDEDDEEGDRDEPWSLPAAEMARLTVRVSDPAAAIYVDGERLPAAAQGQVDVPSGIHVISIVAPDGRRATQEVEVGPGEHWSKRWDFEQLRWR